MNVKLGVSIADDFGTGFSSLGYLHQFQVDVLKIDRCFINAMGENERAAQVVRAVAGLAQGHKPCGCSRRNRRSAPD